MQPLQIGVCSWSLAIPDLERTLATVRDDLGLSVVHLGLFDDSYKDRDRVIKTVQASGIEISATCVGFAGEDYATIQKIAATGGYMPDADWEGRRAKTTGVADLTKELGAKRLSTHVGFVPHDAHDPKYKTIVDRVKAIADILGERGLTLQMETGQETAEALLSFMAAVGRPNLGANFDPANVILYGVGSPTEAVGLLKNHIGHVHMKDANASARPGVDWGEEVVLGTGQADIPRIVSKLRAQGYTGPLVIEREAGNQRLADIKEAIKLLKSLVG